MNRPIYLDYNATTPIDPLVAEAMLPFIHINFGNPSSNHQFGKRAKDAIEHGRSQVAEMLGCHTHEIIFTSGGTESNNLAIKGTVRENLAEGSHIITSAIEHPAVLEVCKALKNNGVAVTILPVDELGRVDPADVEDAIQENTILISIMHANNEIGTIEPISEIANIAHSHNIVLHTDASQSIGKIPVDVNKLDADLLTIAGHKLYAPKGIGALFIRDGIKLEKLMHGASHEMNMRPGTENVIGIVGLGIACELISLHLHSYAAHYALLRDQLESALRDSDIDMHINGDTANRLPNTSSASFYGLKANEIIDRLEGLAVSAGAACHAENVSVSHVLEAIRIPIDYASGTIRFSTGRGTEKQDITQASKEILDVVLSLSP